MLQISAFVLTSPGSTTAISSTISCRAPSMPTDQYGSNRCARTFACIGMMRSKNSALYSTPPKRVARRDMKKRTSRKRDGRSTSIQTVEAANTTNKNTSKDNIETRPLVRSKSVEAGEDYWIDEVELEKFSKREQAIKNRKAMEGEIPKEKLQQEVVAPYKQNWIGLLSVGIIALAVIFKEFPDLLNSPIIPIPDL